MKLFLNSVDSQKPIKNLRLSVNSRIRAEKILAEKSAHLKNIEQYFLDLTHHGNVTLYLSQA